MSKAKTDSIESFVMMYCSKPTFFDEPAVGINCENGFLFVSLGNKTITLTPHHELQRQRHTFATKWEQDASPVFSLADLPDGPLRTLFTGCFGYDDEMQDKFSLVCEMFGAAISGIGTRLADPKAIVLHGIEAENGKTQVLEVISRLMPPDTVSAISPNQFGDQNYLAKLAGKLANISDELGTAKAIMGETFKHVVTGFPITSREVFSKPYEFRPRAQHIFAANELPSFVGGFDSGVRRRLLMLDFNRVIPPGERIAELGVKVVRENTHLALVCAISGVARLLKNGAFTEPKSSKESLQRWIRGSDAPLGWVHDRVVDNRAELKAVDGDVPEKTTREAYADFSLWYQVEGYDERRRPAITTFTQRVKAVGSRYGFKYEESGGRRKFVGMLFKAMPRDMKVAQDTETTLSR